MGNCITETRDVHGYWWRYRHGDSEPEETLTMAIRIAGEVAANEARRRGKTYLVASASRPCPAVYVFAVDHPDASDIALSTMFSYTPRGECIRLRPVRH